MKEGTYQLSRIYECCEVELIQAPPIFGNIEMASVHPIINVFHEIRVVQVNEHENTVVTEVGLCEREDILNVVISSLVPS